MNLSYETKDWLFDNALWIFIGMVAVVMLIGPWQLRRQLRKNPEVKVTTRQSFLISFFAGSFSIILFYGMYFVLGIIMLIIFSILDLFIKFKNPEFSELWLLTAYILVYYILLYCGIRVIIINFSTRTELQTNLPPVPLFNNAESHTELALPPKAKYRRNITNFLKYPIRWTTGWHLTIMCGLCTVIFYICFTGQIRDKSMEAMFATNVNGLAKSLALYKSSNDGLYPADLGDLVNGGFGSASMFETSVAEYGSIRSKENEQFKAPAYFHFFRFPENAPSDLLWLWADPEKYLSAKMPVLFFSGETKFIKKKELPALIERSRKWLADNPSATVGK